MFESRQDARKFFCSLKHSDPLWGPHSLTFIAYSGSFFGVQRRGRDVNHSPQTNTKAKNEWWDTPVLPLSLHVNFTSFILDLNKRTEEKQETLQSG